MMMFNKRFAKNCNSIIRKSCLMNTKIQMVFRKQSFKQLPTIICLWWGTLSSQFTGSGKLIQVYLCINTKLSKPRRRPTTFQTVNWSFYRKTSGRLKTSLIWRTWSLCKLWIKIWAKSITINKHFWRPKIRHTRRNNWLTIFQQRHWFICKIQRLKMIRKTRPLLNWITRRKPNSWWLRMKLRN